MTIFREFASVMQDGGRVLLTTLRMGWVVYLLACISLLGIWVAVKTPAPSRTPDEIAARQERQAQKHQAEDKQTGLKQLLCEEARACKKYSEARLECATAGSLKTCLRIKMGEDWSYADYCSGYDLGAPAVGPLSPDTPNTVECFFLSLGIK
jgi:hypothetical protein